MIIAGILIWNLFRKHYCLIKENNNETLNGHLDLYGNLVLQRIKND